MGDSSDEIDRDQLDENMAELEMQAASRRRRIGGIALIALVAAVAGGFLVYRRMRRPSLADRLHELLPDAIANLPEEVMSRLKWALPISR